MSTAPTKTTFLQFNQPPLEAGEYQITVTQTLDDTGSKIARQTYKVAKEFYVAGDRFHISPEQIKSVFPPAYSLGDHSHVLPHLMLSRNTLPWERQSVPDSPETPWLALLVVYEGEAADVTESIVNLSELQTTTSDSPFFPGISDLEPGQTGDMKVAVLDIKKSLLEAILPTPNDLRWLTHIRQGQDDNNKIVGEDIAVVIANRMPEKGAASTVYLVSLEDRYNADETFDYSEATDGDNMIRLIKLHSWTFTCSDPAADFVHILKNLDRATSTMRLPNVDDATTDSFLGNGFYPLPHKLRKGAQTVSWYHGPLAPQSNTETFTFPAEGADALLRYYESTGMFDVSYAAAWELGTLMALQDTKFSTELYQWKRRCAKCLCRQGQCAEHSIEHLRGGNRNHSPESLPESLEDWLIGLKHLQGVPFNYLVPDEKLLPVESIRFFKLDKLWVEALLDGAFSIGRVTCGDCELDKRIAANEAVLKITAMSGFILRSEAVSGWPGMQAVGYNVLPPGHSENSIDDSNELTLIRQETLSKNVLLCLFEGDLKTLDLQLKPEMLHFGANPKEGGGYEKELRDNTGVEQSAYTIDVPLNDDQVLNINTLLSNINSEHNKQNSTVAWDSTPTSAHLALQMLEGAERVRFIANDPV